MTFSTSAFNCAPEVRRVADTHNTKSRSGNIGPIQAASSLLANGYFSRADRQEAPMLAEIFMLRLEAEAREGKEAAAATSSRFAPVTLPVVKGALIKEDQMNQKLFAAACVAGLILACAAGWAVVDPEYAVLLN
jgi:hypothetical protein